MTGQDLTRMINDSTVSDQDVFEAIKEFTVDNADVQFEIVPINAQNTQELEALERLGTLTLTVRPAAMELFIEYYLRQHGDCCATSNVQETNNEKDHQCT